MTASAWRAARSSSASRRVRSTSRLIWSEISVRIASTFSAAACAGTDALGPTSTASERGRRARSNAARISPNGPSSPRPRSLWVGPNLKLAEISPRRSGAPPLRPARKRKGTASRLEPPRAGAGRPSSTHPSDRRTTPARPRGAPPRPSRPPRPRPTP